MANKKLDKLKLEPLKVTCISTDCNNGLHCFKSSGKGVSKSSANSKTKTAPKAGSCRQCGATLVDWNRIHKMEVADAPYTFQSLKFELIRHHFWHIDIDEKAVNYARRKGISGLHEAVRNRLRHSVGSANNIYDGRQTPMEGSGNPIHYAQHATASCCRKCMEYWHNMPRSQDLTEEQIEYLAELAMMYLVERLPDLTEDGEHVPPIRRAR
jgi:hypothetical protein